jgi:hypothetical protein
MCSKKSFLTAILLILVIFSFQLKSVAQSTGDFRSKTSGQWGNTSTWEIFDGAIWNAAGSLPTSSTSVWIQDGNEVTLAANGSCKDLHLNADIDGADNNRLTISTFTLSVFGKLRTYTGAFNTIPGTNSTGLNNSLTFLTTTSGKLQITGTSRDITAAGEWGVPLNCRDFTLEISMNSASDVATFKTNFRAGAIVVAVGNLTMDATIGGALRPDGGSAGTGTLTVNSGATLTMNSTTFARTASERFGTFTLNSGGFIVVPSGAAGKIAASTVNLNGTVTINSSSLLGNGSIASAASTTTYNNLTTSSTTVTLASATTVNGTLTLGGKITTTSSNTLTIGSSGTIAGASSSNFIDGPLSMTVAATTKTLNFETGKSAVYRRVVLNVVQDAATSTVYTTEVFNTAPTSRTFPSGVTNVSNSRYWNITKGAGANLTSTTTAVFAYGSGDGVGNHTAIQIVKDDGAGSWASLGTGGSASLTGTITTTSGFSSLGDFVIGNVNWVNNGDFRSITNGNWSNTSTWETYNSTTGAWVAAASTPTSSNSIFIQDGHEVTLTANGSCKDLHLNADIDGADNNRLTISTFTLAVSGKLRTYTGASGNIPGANSTGLNNSLTFLTTTSGKLQITGTSRDITSAGEWGVPLLCRDFTLEISMNSASDVATFKTNFRAGAIVVAAGNLTMDATIGGALRPDGGSAGTGTLTVNSGATLTMNSTTFARTASERFGTFTLNSGGFIVVPSGSVGKIAASTVNLNGTVTNNGSALLGNGGIASAASTSTYNNLTTGSTALTLASPTTVNGTLTLGGKITTSSTNTLTIGASGSISGASSSNFIDGPLSMTIAANTGTLTFEIGKGSAYRQIALNLTHSSATSTVYTAEAFNTAPTTRTIPSGITHVSSERHFNVSKGSGATLTGATIAINFDTDDKVNQASTLRIMKDDGAGNWVNIGNTFVSAVPVGFIISGTFTSFSDFVLGNASGGTNPLPVEWLSFDAIKINGSTNLLKWTTASESNNNGFEVERSFDGKRFNRIDFVKGNNTKETTSNYYFTDVDNDLIAEKIVYYRLKQLDNNGNINYSEIRAIESTSTIPVINVYPNPANTVLTFTVSGYTGDASIELTDISGKKISIPAIDFNSKAKTEIDIRNCKSGIYFLKMITPEKTYFRKIAIQ